MGAYLGQHFLKNAEKLRLIADALEIGAGETVIEIGPGHGELTEFLAKRVSAMNGPNLMVIERDGSLAKDLREKYRQGIDIREGNALKLLPLLANELSESGGEYKIVGNIPYYITGNLLRVISDLKKKPLATVIMIQKEVAERLSAKPPRMNLLAAATGFWSEPEIIAVVPKEDFVPAPKIDSAVVRLRTKFPENGDGAAYYKLVRNVFGQPRKTIMNNLVLTYGGLAKEILKKELEALGVSPEDRAQNLSVETLKNISLNLGKNR